MGIPALLAGLWLLLRSGMQPRRIAYPCQQASLMTVLTFLGLSRAAPSALNACRRARKRRRAAIGTAALGAAVVTGVLVWTGAALRNVPRPVSPLSDPPPDYVADVFFVPRARGVLPGRFGGVDDLVTLMGTRGKKFYRSSLRSLTSGPDGLVAADSIVLFKINAQWPERGGTNTDLLRGLIRCLVEHPDGFTGEILVADNGQGGGSFDWPGSNAEDPAQSTADVVADFAAEGWRVATVRWDTIRYTAVQEYADGDLRDGYVVAAVPDPQTGIRVSYPKFRSPFGTYVSYKHGCWDPTRGIYQRDRLVVFNLPVLKTHFIYGVTAAVKNHMGVVTRELGTDAHAAVGRGGMGTVLAQVRLPDLTILDCIWILARPGLGPAAGYAQASRRNQLAAGTDPIALDLWAVRHILIPQIEQNGYRPEDYRDTQDPDNPDSIFRKYLDRSMTQLLASGVPCTNDESRIRVRVWMGDADADGDVDLTDQASFVSCRSGPGAEPPTACRVHDGDEDGDVDLRDAAAFQRTFTGPTLGRTG